MAEAPYLVGIDFGTGGVRIGLFDRTGTPAGFAAAELRTRHPAAGLGRTGPGEFADSALPVAARAGWSTVTGQRRAWPAASGCHP